MYLWISCNNLTIINHVYIYLLSYVLELKVSFSGAIALLSARCPVFPDFTTYCFRADLLWCSMFLYFLSVPFMHKKTV